MTFTIEFDDDDCPIFVNGFESLTMREMVNFLCHNHNMSPSSLQTLAGVNHPGIYAIARGESNALKPLLRALQALNYKITVGRP